jgi:hypothetical protein
MEAGTHMTAITLDKSFTEDLTRDKGFNTTAASVIALGISLVLAIAGIVVSSDLMVIIGGFLAVAGRDSTERLTACGSSLRRSRDIIR